MVSRPVHNLRRRVATRDHLVSVFRVPCTCDPSFRPPFPGLCTTCGEELPPVIILSVFLSRLQLRCSFRSSFSCILVAFCNHLFSSMCSDTLSHKYHHIKGLFGSCNGHLMIPSAGKIHDPFNWEYPRSLQLGISMVPSTGNIHDLFNWKISMIPSTGNIHDPFNWEYP